MTDDATNPNDPATINPDAPSPPANIIEVSAGVVFRHGLVLITQRRAPDHLGGLWEFPGGKRHDGETDEECLKRELMEELGIEVEIKELIETLDHAYAEKTVRLKFFRCAWLRNEPRALGVADFAWVGPGQLENYSFPAADERLLKKLRETPALWR